MRLRFAAVVTAALVALTACADVFDDGQVLAPSNPDAAPLPGDREKSIDSGPDINDAIAHIQEFWTANFAAVSRSGGFKPLPQGRIFPARPGQEVGPCEREFASYEDQVEGNAFAADCPEGQMVAWDSRGLFADLRRRYGGLGPAIVLAHEWGHVVQFQANVRFRDEVYIEQQADCFAGAWFASAQPKFKQLSSKASLDRTIGALLEFRDEPGSSADEANAHGSGFDRVRAFQEGYEGGVAKCADYVRNPPTLVQLPFTTEDLSTGGDLPYDELQDPLIESLNLYAKSLVRTVPELTRVEALKTYKGACNGARVNKSDGPLLVCTKESVILVDRDNLVAQIANFGDGTVNVIFGVAWAELMRVAAGEEPDDGSIGPLLQQLCLTGGFFAVLINGTGPLFFSAGDLDEAIGALTAASEGGTLEAGELFEAVAALRQGVIQGGRSCGLGR